MSRLNNTDLELLQTGQNIDLSSKKYAYLGGEFTENPNDYVEILVHDTNENFLESAVVDKTDYVLDSVEGLKLKTGTILRKLGYDKGRYIIKYNFLRKVAGSYENILVDKNNEKYNGDFDVNKPSDVDRIGKDLFLKEYKYPIHEISPTRQEVRLITDYIKEPENSHNYLRRFYDMQKNTKRIASRGETDTGFQFVPENNQVGHGDSFRMELINDNITLPKSVEGGTIVINKAFVSKIIEPTFPEAWGAGTGAPNDFVEVESSELVARFAITNLDQASVSAEGEPGLSKLYDAFRGLNKNSDISNDSQFPHIQDWVSAPEIISNVGNMNAQKWEFYVFEQNSIVEISSISQRPLNSPATYTWEVFGYDRDNKWVKTLSLSGGYRKYWWDNAIVKTGETGDITIYSDGIGGTPQNTLTHTDHNVGSEGSKIAVELHSKDLHVGVRLHITNDVGQEDEIVIPAFLETAE